MNNLDKLFKSSNSNFINFGKGYVKYLSTLLDNLEHDKINECVKILEEARNSNNSIFIIGNGGSASTASHVANDFGLSVLKNSSKNSKKHYKVISLTDNVSVLSAISNDSSYENIFLDQLKVHFREGDKLIVISASGNSPNLLRAVEWFKENNGTIIGWLGFDGGKLSKMVDLPIVIKSPKGEYAPVEDCHLIINHIIVTWMQLSIINEETD